MGIVSNKNYGYIGPHWVRRVVNSQQDVQNVLWTSKHSQ